MAEVKVLSVWVSLFGMRVLIALKEKGVEYEYQEEDVLNAKSQLLLDSNPIYKKVPVLIHEGKPICESLIIVQYIDETWPPVEGKKPLLPEDPYQRALARFWADYVDKKLYDAGMRIVKSPEGELRDQGKKDLTECFVTLDGALRDVFGGTPYFGGDCIGLLDVALAPFICWFEAFQTLGAFQLPDETQCPHLTAWIERVVEYPSVKEAMTLAPSHKVVEFASFLRKLVLGA